MRVILQFHQAADGRLEVFVRGNDNHLWHIWQLQPNGDWSDWEDMNAFRDFNVALVGDPAAAQAADGRLEVFVRGEDNHLWHIFQVQRNGDWSDWEDMNAFRDFNVALVGDPAPAKPLMVDSKFSFVEKTTTYGIYFKYSEMAIGLIGRI